MSKTSRQDDQAPPPGRHMDGSRYVASVAVLLLVIMSLLAVLWVRERKGRLAAEADARYWHNRCESIESALGQLSVERAAQPASQPGGASAREP